MDRAVGALWLTLCALDATQDLLWSIIRKMAFTFPEAWVRHILLRDCAQVGDGVSNGVSASEGDYDAFFAMVKRDVPAAITKQWPSMPCSDELKPREIMAARQAFERSDDSEAGEADAVGYVDYTRKLLQLCEQ